MSIEKVKTLLAVRLVETIRGLGREGTGTRRAEETSSFLLFDHPAATMTLEISLVVIIFDTSCAAIEKEVPSARASHLSEQAFSRFAPAMR